MKYTYMLKPLRMMEMPNLSYSLKRMGTDTNNYINQLNNANDIDNLQARYNKYLENEYKKAEEERKLIKKKKSQSNFQYSRSLKYQIPLRLNKNNEGNCFNLKKKKIYPNISTNNNNEKNINKEEKNDNIFTNILKLTEDNSRNERNKLKKFRKSKDLYSTIKEENEENKKLFLKTVRYKNNISELCDKINNTCTDFNTTLNGRPKFRFVSQKEIQDSVTKKDLDVNSMRKPKVNAFQNMQLFREVNTLSALSYGLAYNGNNVIKEYLNKRNKKDNNYFTNSKSLNYEEVNKKRKEMFKKAKEIVRISQYCKDQCIKNIDKYNKEVENERMINN